MILLKSVCLSVDVSRLQVAIDARFMPDRLGRYIKLFVSTGSTSSHEFASKFGLGFFIPEKYPNTVAKTDLSASVC